MDRGYIGFARLYGLHQAHAMFVTRAKSNMRSRRVYSSATDRKTGIICDRTISLSGIKAAKDYPFHLRRIRFKDSEAGKSLVFLTNDYKLPATTISRFIRVAGK